MTSIVPGLAELNSFRASSSRNQGFVGNQQETGRKEWAGPPQSVRVPTGDGGRMDGWVGEPAISIATQCCPPVSYLGQTLKRKALWGRGAEAQMAFSKSRGPRSIERCQQCEKVLSWGWSLVSHQGKSCLNFKGCGGPDVTGLTTPRQHISQMAEAHWDVFVFRKTKLSFPRKPETPCCPYSPSVASFVTTVPCCNVQGSLCLETPTP